MMPSRLHDVDAVWNRHGLHPASVCTTFACGMGWALPAVPKLTDEDCQQDGSGAGGRRLRIVAISDTHNRHADLQIPDGDVIVHAGDLTWGGSLEEVESFNAWLGSLPHKHKIVVAGNHDFSLDADVCTAEHWPHLHRNTVGGIPTLSGREVAERYLTNCTYLCGETATIEGLEIYAVPHQQTIKVPGHTHKMAFNLDTEEQLADEFAKIPETTDVLLTHGPPKGVGRLDRTMAGASVGSQSLRTRILQLGAVGRLKACVFGHVHEGYGASSLGSVTCINAANVNIFYKATNPPIVFDVAIPS